MNNFFKVFEIPQNFANFAAGEFAPNEVRMFSKSSLVGCRGKAPDK